MAVTCNITYKGIPVNGAKFTVLGAYQKETAENSFCSYEVEVRTPDDSIIELPEWTNVKCGSDLNKTPLNVAEDDMKARLTAAGATNITDV